MIRFGKRNWGSHMIGQPLIWGDHERHIFLYIRPCLGIGYRLYIITWILYCAPEFRSNLRSVGHCKVAGCMTSILRLVTEAFPPAGQGTILNSHWVISIATNTSLVLNWGLASYQIITAEVGLPQFHVIPRKLVVIKLDHIIISYLYILSVILHITIILTNSLHSPLVLKSRYITLK